MALKQFEENADETLSRKLTGCIVYFLLDHNDYVVYVGQSKHGILRSFEHIKDKTFSSVALLYCSSAELNTLEKYFIQKYRPPYNKRVPAECNALLIYEKLLERSVSFSNKWFGYNNDELQKNTGLGGQRFLNAIIYLLENNIVERKTIYGKGASLRYRVVNKDFDRVKQLMLEEKQIV